MTRVTRYRLLYVLLLVVLAGGAYLVLRAFGYNRAALAVVVVLLLIPGRLQGLFLRPMFRGRHHLAQGRAGDAAREFESMLALLERQPWRQWALWLGWSAYTPSAKAMALNNLGVARSDLGDRGRARADWERALSLDPLYPVPYANLAAAAAADGDAERAAMLLAQAEQLGYTGGGLDQATHRVQELLATVESRGPSV